MPVKLINILPFDTEVMSATTKTTTKTISDAENKILCIIRDNPSISAKAIALKPSITEDGVRYHIKKFKKQGLLEYIGASKTGHWEIKD